MFTTALHYSLLLASCLPRADPKQIDFQLLHTLPLGENRIVSVAVEPDGKSVVTGDEYGKIRVYDAKTGKELREISGHSTAILSLHFIDGGKKLISGEDGHRTIPGIKAGIICIHDYATGKLIDTLDNVQRGLVALSANEESMAYPTKDGFCLVSLPTMSKETSFKTNVEKPFQMALSPGGELLAMCISITGGGYDIRIFETVQGKTVRSLSAKWFGAVHFESKDSLIVTGEKLIRWRLNDDFKEVLCGKSPERPITECPKAGLLAFASGYGDVEILDLKAKKLVGSFRAQSLPITNLAFSADGGLLITLTQYSTGEISHEAPKVWKRVQK